jgi:hypothetical protein
MDPDLLIPLHIRPSLQKTEAKIREKTRKTSICAELAQEAPELPFGTGGCPRSLRRLAAGGNAAVAVILVLNTLIRDLYFLENMLLSSVLYIEARLFILDAA